MSRTLLRTYAAEYVTKPALVFKAVNRRILADGSSDLFVTVFYGILDHITDMLISCNDGHNPPFLVDPDPDGDLVAFGKTGIPLWIKADASWEDRSHQMILGSMLVLYTDGITEAQNPEGEFFDEERLVNNIREPESTTAQDVLERLYGEVSEFIGDTPDGQQDDITLVVLSRHEPKNK